MHSLLFAMANITLEIINFDSEKRFYEIRPPIFNSSGIEGNPTVFYRLMPGSTAQTNKFHTFYLQQRPDNGDTWADIKVNHPLDYESIKEYNLTIRVEVSTKIYNNFAF